MSELASNLPIAQVRPEAVVVPPQLVARWAAVAAERAALAFLPAQARTA